MGSSSYSRSDHDARKSWRASTDTPVFAYDADIRAGKVKAAVNPKLNPKDAKRESRDSDAHPITVPIAVIMDTTGSMASVPGILEERLSHLMGAFLEDKASGKKYLGEGYPSILIGGLDDYDAIRSAHGSSQGTLQVGQFESGIEIDNDLERLWLTGHGGGTYEESYELALYFMATHTAHDHWEKRGKRGYLFLIGDEHPYSKVSADEVRDLMGDFIEADMSLSRVLEMARERYHVFFIIPNLTSHYDDPKLEKDWIELLGQQYVLRLQDPKKICEMIAGAVALNEEHVGLDELCTDGVIDSSINNALVPIARAVKDVSRYSAAGLPPIPGDPGGTERL